MVKLEVELKLKTKQLYVLTAAKPEPCEINVFIKNRKLIYYQLSTQENYDFLSKLWNHDGKFPKL